MDKPTCIVCEEEAVTTAAHIPVCLRHYNQYKHEAETTPYNRPFFWQLVKLDEERKLASMWKRRIVVEHPSTD